jgi:hypothetical protein
MSAVVNLIELEPTKTAPDLVSHSSEFPRSAIVGSLGQLAKLLSDGTEVPEEFLFATALTAFGAIISGAASVKNGLSSDTRLYTILLGESAKAKKSTAATRMIDFFNSLTGNPFPWKTRASVGSAEGLARAFDKFETSRVLLTYDELRSLVEKTKIRSSVLMPMLAQLFEQTSYNHTTKQETVDVKNARLSLIACCTTGTYETLWTSEAIALGLLNRLFVVCASPKPPVAWPKETDPERLNEIRARILAQLQKANVKFDRTKEAEELWKEWYDSRPSSEHVKRLDTIGFRLMPILALTMDKALIDGEVMRHVLSILKYEYEIRLLTDPIDADSVIAKLEIKIRNFLSSKGPLLPRELRRYTHGDRCGMWAYKQALSNVIEAGDVVINKDSDGKERYCSFETNDKLV